MNPDNWKHPYRDRIADAWCWMIGLRPLLAFIALMVGTGLVNGWLGP